MIWDRGGHKGKGLALGATRRNEREKVLISSLPESSTPEASWPHIKQ